MPIYKLSPSDLTFAWDECKYCFYMKVKHNLVLKTPFPGIFGNLANLTSQFYHGKPSAEIHDSLPAGIIKYREQYVKSEPISFPGTTAQCYIKGRFDAVIAFDDGAYGLIDYKTSDPRDEHVDFYRRQLTAYAYALENPAPDALALSPVTRMGLFVITPHRFEQTDAGEMVYVNRRTWMEIPRDDEAFIAFLHEVVSLLDNPMPPLPAEECGLCNYRKQIGDLA